MSNLCAFTDQVCSDIYNNIHIELESFSLDRQCFEDISANDQSVNDFQGRVKKNPYIYPQFVDKRFTPPPYPCWRIS